MKSSSACCAGWMARLSISKELHDGTKGASLKLSHREFPEFFAVISAAVKLTNVSCPP